MKALSFLAALLLTFPNPQATPQASAQPSSSSTQAVALLKQSAAALTGNVALSDISLSGTARRISGSNDESGTVTFKALAGTGSRLDLSFPSGLRSELRNISGGNTVGSWSGPDSVSHSIPYHNLLTDAGWFPVFALSSLLSAPNAVITYAGQKTHNGQPAVHITASLQISDLNGVATSLAQHLSQIDFFLDPNTSLPFAITFNTHPDNNALLDLPVEIQFSDYCNISGSKIPLHVQKFLNNSLFLDFQFQTTALNTGLTAAQVGAQ